jgi:hypothetical protein
VAGTAEKIAQALAPEAWTRLYDWAYVDFDEYRVGANVIWTPVKDFLVGFNALYIRVDPRERVAVPLTTAAGDPTGTFRSIGSEDT